MTRLRNDDAANAAFYNRDAESYDDSRFVDRYGERESVRLRDLLAKRLPAGLAPSALEVGSGTGRATQWLAPGASRLTLVDVSDAMLELASRRAHEANPDLELAVCRASVFDLPFESGTFDVVVSINMLGHLADLNGAVAELSRVVRVGGTMIVSTPSLDSIYMPAGLVVNRRNEAFGQHVFSRWPSRSQVASALDAGSIDVRAVDGAVHVPRAARRIPILPMVLSGADSLASSNRLAARMAPWVLWTGTKRVERDG